MSFFNSIDGIIELSGMKFKAYHGCLESERRDGNEFVVDFSGSFDATEAAKSDRLEDTVDYSRIYEVVKAEMARPSKLLENVCWRIGKSIEKNVPELCEFKVTVSKKNPPVGGECEWSRVTMTFGG